MPMNVFHHFIIRNIGVVPDGYAIVMSAVEASFDGVDIEGWHNSLMYIIGGSPVSFRNLHVENHVLDPGGLFFGHVTLITVANGPATFDMVTIACTTTTAMQLTKLFVAYDSLTTLSLTSVVAGVTITGAGAAQCRRRRVGGQDI